MLKEEKDSLLEYMSSNPFRNMTDLYFFFKEFSKYNINSVSTLKRSPKAFHNFLVKNKKYIIDSDPNRIEHLIDSATNFLESNVLSALYGPHQRYVDIVNGFFSGGEHLLDVGPGEFAGSSILFTKKHDKMSA
ncbi:MAG: hypothetical protein IJW28_01390, partial [Clostridia bacterium]|nr:hypothetical protein [Clostridia bacterium]